MLQTKQELASGEAYHKALSKTASWLPAEL